MGHIFISYSHKDSTYGHKLAETLEEEGFQVWIDDRIHYGSEWPKVVTKNLDVSDGVVVVLSKNAYESDMVQNEITRAREKKKPIFPLLLEGENWLIVQARQFVDVRDESLPDEEFYQRLARVTSRNKVSVRTTTKPVSSSKRFPRSKVVQITALDGAIIACLAIAISGFWAATKLLQPVITGTVSPITSTSPSIYNVEGRLLWNDEPIQGIEVKMATEGTTPFITVTNELGRYSFSLSAGEYQLSYRFPEQVSWTSSQTTPYFSPYRYIQEPILIEEGKATSLEDIHIMKLYDLKMTYPANSGQELPPIPTFEWQAYPATDYYQIWIYESTTYQGSPALIPTDLRGNPGQTRTTTFAFDSPLSASKDYYEVWVIAYNANGHELADYRTNFVIGE